MSVGLEVLGLTLAFVGDIVTAQIYWEGLWMTCVVQSTGQMQCKVYDSMLALSVDLQVSRAILIISILVCVVGTLASIAGVTCTNCLAESFRTKAWVALAAGVLFLVAGVLGLVPPSWTTHQVITDFYNPLVHQGMKEIGAAIFICWGSGALMAIGGGLLVSSSQQKVGGRQDKGQYKMATTTHIHSHEQATSYA